MNAELPCFPLGNANFSRIRTTNRLYVDKTDLLQKLISRGDYYFLARPRRFGKSLTVSTLEAMFTGKKELFSGLSACEWVERQAHPTGDARQIPVNSDGRP